MKFLVIGGVAAGMSAAARARRLDESAEIVVLERSDYVSFANCGLPYHIGGAISERSRLLLQTPDSLRVSLNLDVRTGHEAVAIDRAAKIVRVRERVTGREYAESYDRLALCPGATPLRPPLPGADLPGVFTLRQIEDMDAIKARVDAGAKRAVIIGAGYIGVELAESLRERGVAVDLVEMTDQVLPPLDREMTAGLETHLRAHGVTLHLATVAAAFRERDGALQVELKNGRTLACDFVILAAGVRPDTALARAAGLELGPRGGIRVDEHLRTSDPHIYAGGDAIEVAHSVFPDTWLIPLAGPANRQGRVIGDNVCGRPTKVSSTQGTSVVKVFDMTAGGTGATEKQLRKMNRPFQKVYLHPSGHAGYYPGTAPLHLKVLFEPETGRLLGAQAVGFDGVDKRLDVLATAVRAGLTVTDLENLELAYAPPYGSAKDPVNMAGFVGANLLRGDVRFWYAEDYPAQTEGAVILDVRSSAEYDTWHVPGARNLPLGHLRGKLGELPADAPIRVYCKVGFRSYLAYRLLVQRGFRDVATLAGGADTFRDWHRTVGAEKPTAETPFVPYAEETLAATPSGKRVNLDCRALQCPGPIMRLQAMMQELSPGDEIEVQVSDPGFLNDGPAWCARNGHTLVSIRSVGAAVEAVIRKGGEAAPAVPAASRPDQKTFVVFSGDLDKVLAAFVIANGALAMGAKVTMFFTFWGLNALRRRPAPAVRGKGLLDRMFGAMMPCGPDRLKLSQMNMGGVGTALMKHVMRTKRVESLPGLMKAAQDAGARLVACTMSMDVMGIRREELVPQVELGGVATFLAESDRSNATLFI